MNLIENGAALLPYVSVLVAAILTVSRPFLGRDRDGRTAFHGAAWHGSIDCLKVLLTSFPTHLNSVDVEKVYYTVSRCCKHVYHEKSFVR